MNNIPSQVARVRSNKAMGQAMEFRVWPDLIQQSSGLLHTFLPLLDSGLDSAIHRLTDGEYIPVQVKSSGHLQRGELHLKVWASSLVDDDALIIGGLLTKDGVGPTFLVVDEGTFKRLAGHSVDEGVEVYSMAFPMHPTAATRWRPYLLPREGLAARLLGAEPPPPALEALGNDFGLEPQERHNDWLGFLGETEVVRRLAENPRLDLFRPFPDLEIVEVLSRNNVSRRFLGLQVKTAVPAAHGEAQIHVQKSTFAPFPSTWVVCLAWLADANRFADESLLIPSERLREVAYDDGHSLVLMFRPESPRRGRQDPYRRRLSELGALIGEITAMHGR